MNRSLLFLALLLAVSPALAEEPAVTAAAGGDAREPEDTSVGDLGARASEPPPGSEESPKVISGMSILGNQEAPTSLVIVPWKSSEIGGSTGIIAMLDDSREPVDREVFLRALRYYEIRSERTP